MDGDLLAVQKAKEAKNGQIVVARLGEDVTVKRFKRTRGAIELHAENPEFQTIVVGPGELVVNVGSTSVSVDKAASTVSAGFVPSTRNASS